MPLSLAMVLLNFASEARTKKSTKIAGKLDPVDSTVRYEVCTGSVEGIDVLGNSDT